MLTSKELTTALITNLSSWDWDINSKFGVDKATGEALVETYKEMVAEIKRLKDADNRKADVRDV